jgi:hypothetical protein
MSLLLSTLVSGESQLIHISTSPITTLPPPRAVLRSERCLALLLSQLRSPSLTIVSNACGTLWNFSARSAPDQEELWELGAVPMLQSLTNSKHNTISTCSLAALKVTADNCSPVNDGRPPEPVHGPAGGSLHDGGRAPGHRPAHCTEGASASNHSLTRLAADLLHTWTNLSSGKVS